MNNLYFLAYEATGNNKKHKGWRLFELPDVYNSSEIGDTMEAKLESIQSIIGADEIVATAFNKVK